mmetsp:Transcript_82108/g.190666  ORF Transcript_82108/g.190666 Transcript_82108/m.190666 type:complete len:555 (-) Transcript_82108:298-1962(-)
MSRQAHGAGARGEGVAARDGGGALELHVTRAGGEGLCARNGRRAVDGHGASARLEGASAGVHHAEVLASSHCHVAVERDSAGARLECARSSVVHVQVHARSHSGMASEGNRACAGGEGPGGAAVHCEILAGGNVHIALQAHGASAAGEGVGSIYGSGAVDVHSSCARRELAGACGGHEQILGAGHCGVSVQGDSPSAGLEGPGASVVHVQIEPGGDRRVPQDADSARAGCERVAPGYGGGSVQGDGSRARREGPSPRRGHVEVLGRRHCHVAVEGDCSGARLELAGARGHVQILVGCHSGGSSETDGAGARRERVGAVYGGCPVQRNIARAGREGSGTCRSHVQVLPGRHSGVPVESDGARARLELSGAARHEQVLVCGHSRGPCEAHSTRTACERVGAGDGGGPIEADIPRSSGEGPTAGRPVEIAGRESEAAFHREGWHRGAGEEELVRVARGVAVGDNVGFGDHRPTVGTVGDRQGESGVPVDECVRPDSAAGRCPGPNTPPVRGAVRDRQCHRLTQARRRDEAGGAVQVVATCGSHIVRLGGLISQQETP